MNKKIFLPFLISQVIAFNLFSQDLPDSKVESMPESNASRASVLPGAVQNKPNKTWTSYLAGQARNLKLKTHLNTPTYNLGSKATMFGNYEIKSLPSIGSNYSGVDTWTVNLSGSPLSNQFASLGGSLVQEITFIQQFKSRTDSIVRLPYDPITKLPVNATKALALNEGDFVAYRAPMTVSLGRGSSNIDSENLQTRANISIYMTGEMDVHVFRMPESRVRVRILALKERGAGLGFSTIFTGFSSTLQKLVSFTPLEINFLKSRASTYSFDFVFNLKDESSREAYDQVIGQKLGLTELLSSAKEIASAKEILKERLNKEVSLIDQISREDANLDLADRRIVRLSKSENTTDQNSMNSVSNFFNIVKLAISNSRSESEISLYNIKEQKRNYLIKTYSKEVNMKIVELLGQKSKSYMGLMFDADENLVMKDVLGMQSLVIREELNLDKKEINEIKSRMQKILPNEVMAGIVFPDVYKDKADTIKNAYIMQSLSLNATALENLKSIDYHSIAKELKFLLENWGPLVNAPMQDESTANEPSARMSYLKEQNYPMAYSYELHYIPEFLAAALDKNTDINKRAESLDRLYHIPLYKELGSALIMRLIPRNKLAESISFEFKISGRNITETQSVFPKNANLKANNLFNQIVEENAFATDRSFNLRQYMNEDGLSFSLKELTEKFQ